jgi:alpha-amylase/alpha-mannosidase (GH57 family)
MIMTRVALLWHMHQPFYQDLETGEHILPWVRVHATKDYWGMVALLREFPEVRVTMNLVPSLLVQLDAFARDAARDRHLELGLKPASQLTDEERVFCVEQFFHAHTPRMIDPFPRYAELLAKRGDGPGSSARAEQFSIDEIRDLQVWHKLVWIDPLYVETDARVQRLFAKGRIFTEEDKLTLRAVELELLGRVVPEYRHAAARGQVELSTSPFYHPILPLLCDTDIHARSHPESRLPAALFRHPDDAAEQLRRAVELHEQLFGAKPRGLWPSEGGISDQMVQLVADAGFGWMATDEGILARTVGHRFTRDAAGHVEEPETLYRPYRVGSGTRTVACGFRDHTLSDLIGFTYASWPSEAAADDFVRRLAEAGERYSRRTGGEEATIFVILDGENAWEHYDGQGRPFLRALYRRLSQHPALRTVTMTDACAEAMELLPSIFPGSWINADFSIWIGHADDQRAWTQLAHARRALDVAAPGLAEDSLVRAREELLIAEGSDWFWWYGDDHSSEHDFEFDDLFRRHLRSVYRALELPVPEELFVTNISTRPPVAPIYPPTGFVAPVIDGETTSYFEWIGAGCVVIREAGGTMRPASVQAGVSLVEFGIDLDHLFLRVAGDAPMKDLLGTHLEAIVRFLRPRGLQAVVGARQGDAALRTVAIERAGGGNPVPCPGSVAAVGEVLELQLPFACLGVSAPDTVAFLVVTRRAGVEVARYPQHQAIELAVPDGRFGAMHWTV